ncbi:unnamed protein product [Adineta ricciae]|uniref:Uncharacterized protein n=1 Tax=Adineta ricciae TaxID=249248 RepID=A0A814Z9K6_ADIRI|nr:unnamed protein product [Adineta ricciae]
MSSYYHREERRQSWNSNAAPLGMSMSNRINIPVQMAPPSNLLSPAIYAGPLLSDVGNVTMKPLARLVRKYNNVPKGSM